MVRFSAEGCADAKDLPDEANNLWRDKVLRELRDMTLSIFPEIDSRWLEIYQKPKFFTGLVCDTFWIPSKIANSKQIERRLLLGVVMSFQEQVVQQKGAREGRGFM